MFCFLFNTNRKSWEKFSYVPEASNLQPALTYAEMVTAVPAPAVHPHTPPRCWGRSAACASSCTTHDSTDL